LRKLRQAVQACAPGGLLGEADQFGLGLRGERRALSNSATRARARTEARSISAGPVLLGPEAPASVVRAQKLAAMAEGGEQFQRQPVSRRTPRCRPERLGIAGAEHNVGVNLGGVPTPGNERRLRQPLLHVGGEVLIAPQRRDIHVHVLAVFLHDRQIEQDLVQRVRPVHVDDGDDPPGAYALPQIHDDAGLLGAQSSVGFPGPDGEQVLLGHGGRILNVKIE